MRNLLIQSIMVSVEVITSARIPMMLLIYKFDAGFDVHIYYFQVRNYFSFLPSCVSLALAKQPFSLWYHLALFPEGS